MGATRWPPDLTLRALGQVERFLRDDADMAAPMVLGGVPWVDAAAEATFSNALQAELTWRCPGDHPRCLSLGALDTMRRGLAALYAVTDNLPLPPEWAGRAFDDPQVIRAYTAFCLRAAEIARPDWLVIGVEVNLLRHFAPDLWPGYLTLHRAAYAAVKDRFPDLPLLTTVAVQHFMGMADETDVADQASAMAELADATDMLGWSIYPHLSWDVPTVIPPGFYDPLLEFGARLRKPMAITESGTASAPVPLGWYTLEGTPERQVQTTEALLTLAEEGDIAFFVNWTSHDYPAFLEKIPKSRKSWRGYGSRPASWMSRAATRR